MMLISKCRARSSMTSRVPGASSHFKIDVAQGRVRDIAVSSDAPSIAERLDLGRSLHIVEPRLLLDRFVGANAGARRLQGLVGPARQRRCRRESPSRTAEISQARRTRPLEQRRRGRGPAAPLWLVLPACVSERLGDRGPAPCGVTSRMSGRSPRCLLRRRAPRSRAAGSACPSFP